MEIEFTDIVGERGVITEEFAVEYEGPWRDDLEAFVEKTVDEHAGETSESIAEDIMQELVISLPYEVECVVSVEVIE